MQKRIFFFCVFPLSVVLAAVATESHFMFSAETELVRLETYFVYFFLDGCNSLDTLVVLLM